jgi:hypothetical protein
MADEAGLLDFYRLNYQPLSVDAHSMWNHVARANLRYCTNPLHRYHRVPVIKSFSPNYHVWDTAAQMLAMTFKLVDDRLDIKVVQESACALLDRRLEEYAKLRGAEADAANDAQVAADEIDETAP